MNRIAICEDEHSQQQLIKHLLNLFAKENEKTFSITEYYNASALLNEATDVEPFDLYLLDIYLPDETGISLAKKLREKNIVSPIIFITTSRDHALDAYGVQAVQYLLKPLDQTAFFSAMHMAIQREQQEKSRFIILKCDGKLHTIPTKQIIYTESYGHNQNIYFSNNSMLSVRMNVSELFAKLSFSKSFVRCGSSYILNLENIKNMNSKMITMSSGTTIPIPRGSYADLKTQYFQYYSER